jgi:ABC-type transporter Mla MlaB component
VLVSLLERVASAMTAEGADSGTIAVEGPATIYEVAALREILREAVAQGHDLRIDLAESGKWDLAGVQLLVSCVNTARGQGRSVRLVNVPHVCREIAERSGLKDWLDSLSG